MSKSKKDGRDPKDGRRKLKKDYWTTTVKSGDVSVYAWENTERRGMVYVKYVSPTSSAKDGREKKKLPGGITVRDERGRLDPTLVKEAEEAAKRIAARLALGQDPFNEPTEELEPEVLTLRRGFRLALDLTDGKFPVKTRRHDELRRAQAKLEDILGPNITWAAALDSTRVRGIWRTLARKYANRAGKKRACGARQTEVTVDALYTIADWLEEQKHLPENSVKRINYWREKLKEDWKYLTGEDASRSDEDMPRHSEDEMRKLFGALDDPRRRVFRALLSTVPEAALASAFWSGLAFDESGTPTALTVRWERRFRTKGMKRDDWASRPTSQRYVLDARQRELMAGAISGYLRLLEGARVSGAITDYPLFPSGPLLDGMVSASATESLSLGHTSVLSVDERFELAFELGGEQRMGQVIRSTRKKLTIPGVDRRATIRTPTFGALEPPPARKKATELIAFTESQLARVLDVLEHGYLREYEAAYRAGRIDDYALFPAERMIRGLAKWRAEAKPLSRDAALKMFHRLEAVAGVESMEGRGWYGVRRIASDLVEDMVADERVQNAVMANSKDVRRRHYQQKRRAKILAKAREARELMRTGEAPTSDAGIDPAALRAALQGMGIQLSPAQAAALAAEVSTPASDATGTEGA